MNKWNIVSLQIFSCSCMRFGCLEWQGYFRYLFFFVDFNLLIVVTASNLAVVTASIAVTGIVSDVVVIVVVNILFRTADITTAVNVAVVIACYFAGAVVVDGVDASAIETAEVAPIIAAGVVFVVLML